MAWHRNVVATEFRVGGALLGIASLVVLADSIYTAYAVRSARAPDGSPPLDIGKYGLVGLLANGGQVAGRAVHTLLITASWLAAAVAVVAFVTLLLALLVYLTGRGIAQQAGWARILGGLLSLGLALITIAALTIVDHGAAAIVAVPAVLSLYTLWVLIWRYA